MENEQQPKIVNHNEMHNCNVFLGDSYGGIFPLPGAQVQITQNLGGKKKSTQFEGETESEEERKNRKEAAIAAICKRLDFAPEMLGFDEKHLRLTNERIGYLMKRCLGVGYVPPRKEYLPIMELLWVLLIDDRNQCHKEAGELYFRQTVLNIIGYFASKRLISGAPRDIARAVFADADTNLAKNVSRGISSAVYPEGLAEIFDFYIEKLQHGEI